jgi:hypothetical protein
MKKERSMADRITMLQSLKQQFQAKDLYELIEKMSEELKAARR